MPLDIRMELLRDPPYFTTAKFSDMIGRVTSGLKHLFNTKNELLLGTGSGSLGMEAVVMNFFEPGDQVIVLNHGKYGQNWINMCRAHGLKVIIHTAPDGEAVDRESLRSYKVSKEFDPKGVFITHVETTTGVKANLPQYAKLVRDKFPNALICVDAVSSFLSEYISDKYYDVAISASQKGLQCPPGMFFMSVNDEAIGRSVNLKSKNGPKFMYFDVENEVHRSRNNITTFTPAAHVIAAVDVSIKCIEKKTLEGVARNQLNCMTMIRDRLGRYFNSFTNRLYLSNALTAFAWDGSEHLADKAEELGLVIGRGLRENKNRLFRIMHFGWDLEYEECESAVSIIESLTHPYP